MGLDRGRVTTGSKAIVVKDHNGRARLFRSHPEVAKAVFKQAKDIFAEAYGLTGGIAKRGVLTQHLSFGIDHDHFAQRGYPKHVAPELHNVNGIGAAFYKRELLRALHQYEQTPAAAYIAKYHPTF